MDKYLKKIGFRGKVELTKESLDRLVQVQLTHVPFENLDVWAKGTCPSLEKVDLFEKIVVHNRGGYCFELNAALAALLSALGYVVKNRFARFLRGEDGIPPRRHRVLLVECGNDVYVCDVGIGQSAPRYPLLLKEGVVQEQFGETYKFERDAFLGWVLCDLHEGVWRKFFSFTDEDNVESDFLYASYFCENSPESKSNKFNIVSLKTDAGRKTVSDMSYKEFSNDKLIYIEENISEERFDDLLKKEFGLVVM